MAEKTCLNSVVVVLPSLDPDAKFSRVVQELIEAGFERIVIVDDGSAPNRQHWFEEAGEHEQCVVLHHEVNKGKGRALKDAFAYIIEHYPDAAGAVTIDGDGQHLTHDIIACGNKMLELGDRVVLGVRDFDAPNVPPRSVTGNKMTRNMFWALFRIRITDTQTGLRAVPMRFLPAFCEIAGERFEYETNMLLQMKRQKIGFYENTIETIYDEADYSSHYHAVKDSWRVFKVMAKFMLHK